MKAKTAYSCFRFKMSPQTGCPINVSLKVFYSLVSPIALYGTEIWGWRMLNQGIIDNLLQHLLERKDMHPFRKFTFQINAIKLITLQADVNWGRGHLFQYSNIKGVLQVLYESKM